MSNAARYNYLKDSNGRFHNPFDRGFRKNCMEFLFTGFIEDVNTNVPSLQPVLQNGLRSRIQMQQVIKKDLWILPIFQSIKIHSQVVFTNKSCRTCKGVLSTRWIYRRSPMYIFCGLGADGDCTCTTHTFFPHIFIYLSHFLCTACRVTRCFVCQLS